MRSVQYSSQVRFFWMYLIRATGREDQAEPRLLLPGRRSLDDGGFSAADLALDADLVAGLLGNTTGAPAPDARDVHLG